MATIQIRDVPDDVAETFKRRAAAAGKSLQSYMRDHLIETAKRRDKAEVMAIVEQMLASSLTPGISKESYEESRRELEQRGE
jgi:antitoxin FitA